VTFPFPSPNSPRIVSAPASEARKAESFSIQGGKRAAADLSDHRRHSCQVSQGPAPSRHEERAARDPLSEFDCTMTKIYVGNLPFSASEDEVRTLFAQHGTVESVSLITDRETGRPRGFGFVEMNRADASRAIQNLNGKDMGGRPLRVNEAQERSGGGQRGPRRW